MIYGHTSWAETMYCLIAIGKKAIREILGKAEWRNAKDIFVLSMQSARSITVYSLEESTVHTASNSVLCGNAKRS